MRCSTRIVFACTTAVRINPEHYFLGESCPWCAQSAPESREQEQGTRTGTRAGTRTGTRAGARRRTSVSAPDPLRSSGHRGPVGRRLRGGLACGRAAGPGYPGSTVEPCVCRPAPFDGEAGRRCARARATPHRRCAADLVRVLADQRSPGRRAHAIALPGGHGWSSRGTLRRGVHGPRL